MARQQLLIRGLGSDLEAARRQSRQQAGADAQQANAAEARTRQLLLQLEEATAREAAWRRQTNEQAANPTPTPTPTPNPNPKQVVAQLARLDAAERELRHLRSGMRDRAEKQARRSG